jgi:hypothetical protein
MLAHDIVFGWVGGFRRSVAACSTQRPFCAPAPALLVLSAFALRKPASFYNRSALIPAWMPPAVSGSSLACPVASPQCRSVALEFHQGHELRGHYGERTGSALIRWGISPHCACLVWRHGRLGWFLDEVKDPRNADIEPQQRAIIDTKFAEVGLLRSRVALALENMRGGPFSFSFLD